MIECPGMYRGIWPYSRYEFLDNDSNSLAIVVGKFFSTPLFPKTFSETDIWRASLDKSGHRPIMTWLNLVSRVSFDLDSEEVLRKEDLLEEGLQRMLELDVDIVTRIAYETLLDLMFSQEEQDSFYPDYRDVIAEMDL